MRLGTTRRWFLARVSSCPFLFVGLAPLWKGLLRAQPALRPRYDLLVKGGRLVDPSQEISTPRDVAVSGGKIARIAETIEAAEAREVSASRGTIVPPGRGDLHVHV